MAVKDARVPVRGRRDWATGGLFVGKQSLFLNKRAGSDMVRVALVVLVEDGMDHDGAAVDGQY